MTKRFKKLLLISLISISIFVFGIVIWRSFFYIPSDEIELPSSLKDSFDQSEQNKIVNAISNKDSSLLKTKELSFLKYPRELRIPSIKVNTKIQYVGITKKGNIATPNNFFEVGWFKYGTIPGKKGSAIISGHVDNGLALPAIFNRLDQLNAGDTIYIDTVGGETLKFVVKDFETYDFDSPTEEIFNQSDGKYLKLITCAGVWVDLYKTHNKRLVVTAELI